MATSSCSIPHFKEDGMDFFPKFALLVMLFTIDIGNIFLLLFKTFPKFEAVIRFDLSMYQVDSICCLMVSQQKLNDDSPEMPTLLVKFSSTSSLAINTFISSWSDGMWVCYSAKRCWNDFDSSTLCFSSTAVTALEHDVSKSLHGWNWLDSNASQNKDAFPADLSFSVRDCNSLLVVSRANGGVAQKSIFPLTNGLFCFLPSSDFSKTRLENLKAVSSV